MPKGPKGQKRPVDMNQLAKTIVDIATGENAADSKKPVKKKDDKKPQPKREG